MKAIGAVGALLAVTLVGAALDEDAGVRHWWHLRNVLADAQRRIAALREETARLHREAERLEAEPFAIERAIREELGLARPGQTLVRLRAGDVSSVRIP